MIPRDAMVALLDDAIHNERARFDEKREMLSDGTLLRQEVPVWRAKLNHAKAELRGVDAYLSMPVDTEALTR